MENYYQYFVDKGNHPAKDTILQQEETFTFTKFSCDDALLLLNAIVSKAKSLDKNVAVRVKYQQDIIVQYLMEGMDYQNSLSWIQRKEKMVEVANHSSYYAFLDNQTSHLYDAYIFDPKYAICGGAFPIIEHGKIVGTITVTGLRPQEDHQLLISGLEKVKQEKEGIENE